jgi:predicted kinase
MKPPVLYIFAGLPASGKSTLAKMLAKKFQAAYFRIDTVEQGIKDLCNFEVNGEGYRLTHRIIKDNLKLGISSVSDSCNPLELTRDEWNEVAKDVGVDFVDIEVICSDEREHRKRAESRISEIESLVLPTWQAILDRKYDQWRRERIVIDTAGISESEAFEALLFELKKQETNKLLHSTAGTAPSS